MANTSARMLQLLSLLQTHRYWPGTELAERLDVSDRTLRRDVERLRELGYPVQASRGVAGGYQLAPGATLPPLLLDDEEAVAIAIGLRTAASSAVTGIAETSVRALAKLVQVLPPGLRRRIDALHAYTVPTGPPDGPTVDPIALTVIAQACRDDERLTFEYTKKDGERSTRLIEPHRLVALGRRWYLVAWDLDRHDWRSFRVDRLASAASTGVRFRPRPLPAPDAAAFVRDGLSALPTRHHLIVEIQAPAATVEALVWRYATVEPIDDTSCRLVMNVDTFEWPMMVLGSVGATFDVIQPVELRDYLRQVGALFRRASRN